MTAIQIDRFAFIDNALSLRSASVLLYVSKLYHLLCPSFMLPLIRRLIEHIGQAETDVASFVIVRLHRVSLC
jgi:hypothetical protein